MFNGIPDVNRNVLHRQRRAKNDCAKLRSIRHSYLASNATNNFQTEKREYENCATNLQVIAKGNYNLFAIRYDVATFVTNR